MTITDIISDRRAEFIEIDCGCRTSDVLNYLTASIIEAYELGKKEKAIEHLLKLELKKQRVLKK